MSSVGDEAEDFLATKMLQDIDALSEIQLREDIALSKSIIGALLALTGISQNDDEAVEYRIDAASRVLAYAGLFADVIDEDMDDGGAEDPAPLGPGPDGSDEAC